ncbi:uncharacterized protein MELLADRAFT_84682 [Melampsora larici-populina 98AG31]|uniref:Uncharacterized protein n=1 Tax=Melampsora larici-populina (strain 98AG31 / pathotype 3-4-7) TaxID=747676 RepID=F4RGG4_MELLP|nr:uncharacterized protein MELLADRAFT_84682 [Melampsora larici-populina 98AG31]EGG08503.1 hypothetical protein MELLADRAFT_84682 [Melampsora larici-populina 98AG31]
MAKKKTSASNSPATSGGNKPPNQASSNPPPLPHGQPPAPPGTKPDLSEQSGTNAVYFKVQSLSDDLRGFLCHDYKEKKQSFKNLDYYRIFIVHFDPGTTARPTNRKDKLIERFEAKVLPLIKTYQFPAPPIPMQTDQPSRKDFNPLARRTKRADLVHAILQAKPKTVIPTSARGDGLLYLYKEHVDPDLVIPGYTKFIKPPNVVRRAEVNTLFMEDLRLTLQDQAPHVFVHSIPMTHPVLVNLYIKFVLEEEVEPGLLVCGFHYSLLREKP